MISAVVLTKNEEKNIIDCLESIAWCDELIVVDDLSTDRTEEVIKNLHSKKIHFLKHSLEDDFSRQRNFALAKAKNEWILFVDADERVSSILHQEINNFLIKEKHDSQFSGMVISRKDVIWGKLLTHGETGKIKLLRLARKNAGTWQGKVHEEWIVNGNIGSLENYIVHYPHQTISEFLTEINFYTTIRAKELFAYGEKSSILRIILYPKAKFFINYILKLGFLDGVEGLMFAVLMSFHSFLVRAKLWVYSNKQL